MTCYPDWWGCGENGDCCNNNCNPESYKCGDTCHLAGSLCGNNADCCSGSCNPDALTCNAPYSPILINIANSGSDHLTSAADGVIFDIDADGTTERVAWTSAQSSVGFLAWDRNGNGTIDDGSELFGTATRLRDGTLASNGFEALREWDSNGDGRIDSADPMYGKWRVWFDSTHNGYSESHELFSLPQVGIKSLLTQYRESRRRDQYGNAYKYEGIALLRSDHREEVVRRIFDVVFQIQR
jgi:hypothetical protein